MNLSGEVSATNPSVVKEMEEPVMVYVLIQMLPNPEEIEALEEYREKAKKIRNEYQCEVLIKADVSE